MSQIPSDQSSNNRRRQGVDYDELIAMFIAFLTLGSVLFWGLTRSGMNLFGQEGLFDADGAPALIGTVDSDSRLDSADELVVDAIPSEDDGLGFGAAQVVGAAGAGSIVADLGSSAEGAKVIVSQPSTPAAINTVPAAPEEPPKQIAQPAAEPETPAAPVAPPLEVTQAAVVFSDVPDGYWAKPYIDALSERDVFDGNIADGVAGGNTFKPDEPISRAQLAMAIAKAFPLSEDEAAIDFSDVATDFWALDAINAVVKGGYMNGFPDGSFKPDQPVPRVQALTAMVTGSKATAQGNAAEIVKRYGDAADIQGWAVPKMAAATQAGLVVNHPDLTKLNPNQPATRAEVAAMIYQTLVAQKRIANIGGEYIVQP
ncbi:S-layer homology domain-containing protein [Leptothoe sp. PORK10 BA2]|uniref:S-layer homology domain-containing protein n=1 Tax=Leptothoe sp. PORK10 BA2 TaxID=3110254 RepID=UPI002B1FD301|nr:S-layer homology domain-containing protein [Leptothoe sp. PORK10 BA2]MEA5462206.1 S-layer homology domain-containing protein [Leptothoe sp. PORK10 BA2]